jgi:hypothetical protein
MLDLVLNHFLPPLSVIASIGISDMVEYYISPRVHLIHNCPDIMGMKWNDYGGWHAFLSGVKYSWFLIILACLFKHNWVIITCLNIVNILLPVGSYLTGKDNDDAFFSHKMLYIINPVLIMMSILI